MRIPPFVGHCGEGFEGNDYSLRQKDAKLLARRIEEKWAAAGHRVECHAVAVRNSEGRIVSYAIRSTLRDGLPVGGGENERGNCDGIGTAHTAP